MKGQLKAVIELITLEYPTAKDYNVVQDDQVEILDANDKVLGVISSDKLTKLWNAVEERGRYE